MPTLRDIVAEHEPNELCNSCFGGVTGCPYNYDCLQDYMLPCTDYCGNANRKDCDVCWSTEAIPKPPTPPKQTGEQREEPQEPQEPQEENLLRYKHLEHLFNRVENVYINIYINEKE